MSMSAPETWPKVVEVSLNDKPGIEKVIEIIASAFKELPVSIAIINQVDNRFRDTHDNNEINNIDSDSKGNNSNDATATNENGYKKDKSTPTIPLKRRIEHFRPQIEYMVKTEGSDPNKKTTILQSGDWSVVAIWKEPVIGTQTSTKESTSSMNPHNSITNVTSEDNQQEGYKAATDIPTAPFSTVPLVQEFFRKSNIIKEKFLSSPSTPTSTTNTTQPLRPYYYLDFLARNPAIPSIKGGISSILKPYIQKAHDNKMPIWLEAATKAAAQVYERYGFRTVKRVVLGKGVFDSRGWMERESSSRGFSRVKQDGDEGEGHIKDYGGGAGDDDDDDDDDDNVDDDDGVKLYIMIYDQHLR